MEGAGTWFVHVKLADGRAFWALCSLAKRRTALRAGSPAGKLSAGNPRAESRDGIIRVTNREHAAAGVIHAIQGRGLGSEDPAAGERCPSPNSAALSAGLARRGVQEDNRSIKGSRCGSVGFIGGMFSVRSRVYRL